MTVAVVSCSSSSVWHGFKDLEQSVLSSPPHHLPRLIDQYREQLIEPIKNQYTKNANSKNRIENGAKTAIDTDEGMFFISSSKTIFKRNTSNNFSELDYFENLFFIFH